MNVALPYIYSLYMHMIWLYVTVCQVLNMQNTSTYCQIDGPCIPTVAMHTVGNWVFLKRQCFRSTQIWIEKIVLHMCSVFVFTSVFPC
jgi:hypothetical protein